MTGTLLPRSRRDPDDATDVSVVLSVKAVVLDYEGNQVAELEMFEVVGIDPQQHVIADIATPARDLTTLLAEALDPVTQRAAWGA